MMLLMRRLGVYVILLLFILWCQAKQTSVESRRTLLNQTADKNDLHKNGQHMMNIDVTISKKVSSYQNFVKGAGLYNATLHAENIYNDEKLRHSLQQYGVMHLPDGIPSKLVHAAIKYVNKKIGEMKYFGAYGGKNNFQRDVSPSNDPEILNLFNKSFLKHLFELILGPRESKYEMVVGQMMPRFPGDFCYKEMHWHIDYVDVYNAEQQPSLPAVPNFDALVGVLLSDLHVEKSGELCTYPSSHRSLSKYFTKHTKEFEKLHQSGGSNVYSIMKDEEVFESDVYHCLGKAGDVFILNYMNAHYVTCNNSPNIRNNIYFRVWGNTFADHCREVYHFELENFGKDGCSNRTSMLNPLVHWRL